VSKRNRDSLLSGRRLVTASIVAALLTMFLLAAAPAAFGATFTVTTTADGSGACTALECTLREAVEEANAASEPSTIVVPAGFYELTEAEFSIGSDLGISGEVAIEGAGAAVTTIVQRAECGCRVFYANSPLVTISGVTIAQGEPIENPLGEVGGDVLFEPEGQGLLRLEGDVIAEGIAGEAGGGVFSEEGELEILDSTIVGNEAEIGGGVFYENDSAESAVLERDTFVENFAEEGGGLALETGEASVVNSTFTENGVSSASGGAIFARDGFLRLLNDTLAGDSAEPSQAGAYGAELYGTSGDSFEIVNTIVGPAGAGQIGSECFLDANLTSENDIDAGNSCGFEAASASLIETEPQLEPLAENGGPTETMALRSTSPAIDSANGAACPATDQRGVSRPQGSGCDIGAYEYQPPGGGGEEQSTPTATPKPAPLCSAVTPKASSFKPKLRPGNVVPGVRVRLATDLPSLFTVRATLLWKDEGKSRATGLGKLSVSVNRWRRVRFELPARLRDKLAYGTPVKVKLHIEATPEGETGCGATVTNRTIHARVVKVFPHAIQFARPR